MKNPTITIQELITFEPFIDISLLAGWSGRANKFNDIYEITDNCPNTFNKHWLIVLTEDNCKPDRITSLLEQPIAGILLIGFSLNPLPQKVIDLAEEKGIPLLSLTCPITLQDLVTNFQLITKLKEYDKFLQLSQNSLYNYFMKLNQTELLNTVGKFIANPVVIVNKAFQIISCSCHKKNNNHDLEILELIYQKEKNNRKKIKNLNSIWAELKPLPIHNNKPFNYLIMPLIADDYLYGFIVALENNNPFTEMDQYFITQGGKAFLHHLIHRKNIEEMEKKYKSDFIHDLLFNNFASKEDLINRGKLWGFNLNLPHQLMVMEVDNMDMFTKSKEFIDKLQLITMRIINNYCHQPIISEFRNQLIIIFPTDSQKEKKAQKKIVKDLAVILQRQLQDSFPHTSFSIGMGKFYKDTADLCRSYQEAINALELGKFLANNGHITHFEDLGTMKLLASISYEQLDDFYKEYLGEVINYDRQNDTNLLQTLYIYFQQNGDFKLTAEKLFMHPNSLRYRIKKIEEITEMNLQKYEDSLNLFIACKIAKMRYYGLGALD